MAQIKVPICRVRIDELPMQWPHPPAWKYAFIRNANVRTTSSGLVEVQGWLKMWQYWEANSWFPSEEGEPSKKELITQIEAQEGPWRKWPHKKVPAKIWHKAWWQGKKEAILPEKGWQRYDMQEVRILVPIQAICGQLPIKSQ